jgi:hypothetical protein
VDEVVENLVHLQLVVLVNHHQVVQGDLLVDLHLLLVDP